MPEQQIIGKESKRPKHQILRELIGRTETPLSLWFVEDRLKPAIGASATRPRRREALPGRLGLQYPAERESAQNDPRIQLLSLSQFAENFSALLKI